MNAQEFEEAVREMRRRQKRFFSCRKDSPDKEKYKLLMRKQESIVGNAVKVAKAVRPININTRTNDRERFFLLVAEMMDKQREWREHGGGMNWMMTPARETEKAVDIMLAEWDKQREEERRKKLDEERKRQLKLF